MAGGVIVAGELWVPGQKLISIPSGKVFGNEYGLDSMFRLVDMNTVEYIGAEDKVASISEFYSWLKKNAAFMMRSHDPANLEVSRMVSMDSGYRMRNPEHLIGGSFVQDAQGHFGVAHLRELWTSASSLGETDLLTDKVYIVDGAEAQERKRTLDNGYRGLR